MEFYSATKKNDILSFAGKWMELANILLSGVRQVQKDKDCFTHIWKIDTMQIQTLSYIQISIYSTCTQKWECQRRLREEEKKKRIIVDSNEINHIGVGIRHKTLKTTEQCRVVGKGEKTSIGVRLIKHRQNSQ
jgi:hypothetical protein